jgi:hypothetical protein
MGFFCGLRKVAFLISKTNDERERGGGGGGTTKEFAKKEHPSFQNRRGHQFKKKEGWMVVNGTDEMILLIKRDE